jgi:dynactin-4
LLFCDECNHTRCPKCWTEEMIYWYCPNCLFEVPSSGVKSDRNR